jgi:hypothetical protein
MISLSLSSLSLLSLFSLSLGMDSSQKETWLIVSNKNSTILTLLFTINLHKREREHHWGVERERV